MSWRRNVILLQVFSALQGCMFLLPVVVPYYREAAGLSFRDFLLGEAVFAAVVIAAEVPTGWLSDIWQRRHTLCAGMGFYALGFFILYGAHSLPAAVSAQGVIGIGVSLISGTVNALLYDTLAAAKREDEFRRLEGRRHGTVFYALALSCLIGAALYGIDPHLPVLATIGSAVLAMGTALCLYEPEREKEAVKKHPLSDMLETVRYALHGHPEIAGIVLFCAVLYSATKTMMWSQQPYYGLLGLPESQYGVLMAAGFALSGIAGHFGHVLDGRLSNRAVFRVMLCLVSGAFLAAGWRPGIHGVALLLCGSVMWGFGWPRVQDAINRRVSGARRATILSTANLAISLAFIPVSSVFGAASERFGLGAALCGMGVYLLAAGGAVLGLVRKRGG